MAQGVRFKSLDSCIVLPKYPQTNRWYGSCSFFSSAKAVAAKRAIGRPQYRKLDMNVFTAAARPGGNARAVEGVDPVKER